MEQNSEKSLVDSAVRRAMSPGKMSKEDYLKTLIDLENYECWDSWFHCVKSDTLAHPAHLIDNARRIARVQLVYFDDVASCSETCKELVANSKMHYEEFRTSILDMIVDNEDFVSEGTILQSTWDRFSEISDKIVALERICFIYEKKHHNEGMLQKMYEKLLKIHPENPKALRYFRTAYSQVHDWPAVVDILKKLLGASKHPQEVFRHAQELAAVYLYQLDDPDNAIRLIEEYCVNSTLDTSTIHYEAYYRLGKYDGCLRVLRGCLINIDEDTTRAVVHCRIASIYEQQGNYQLAYENFEKAFRLNEGFLEAIEGAISASLKLRNWSGVKDWLNVLLSKTTSSYLVSQLRAGVQRLEEGLKNADRG